MSNKLVTTADNARFLNDLHIQTIPVHFKTKKPALDDWGNKPYTSEQIEKLKEDKNLGMVLGSRSGGLIDIDADSDDAKKHLKYFLPKTGMIYGRKSNPRSHHLYLDPTSTVRFKQFHDPGNEKGKPIFEIRCDGKPGEDGRIPMFQTVCPPSIHESGERIAWVESDTLTIVDPIDFRRRCGKAAVATLLRRYVGNKPGERHICAGALAGWLYSAHWSVDEAADLISIGTTSDGDDFSGGKEHADRDRMVRDTFKKLEEGEAKITGYRTVVEIIGEKVARTISEWLELKPDDLILPEECNDESTGELFRRLYGENLRWLDVEQSWYSWKEGYWARQEKKEVRNMAHELLKRMSESAKRLTDDAERTRYMKYVFKCSNNNHIEIVIKSSEAPLCITPEELDSNLYLFSLKNGTFNAKTGILQPHDKNDLITRFIPLNYDKTAKAPRFKQFLEELFPNKPEMIFYLLRIFGYCLTGDVSERVLFMFKGDGTNGKSVLTRIISKVLAGYAGRLDSDDLMLKKGGRSHTSGLAALRGKRMAIVNELSQGQRLDAGLIKSIAGGGDLLPVRPLYGLPFDMLPSFKLIINTNVKPSVSDLGAFWTRLKLIPFDVVIPKEKKDLKLEDKLWLESEGILNLMIAGLEDWRANGLNEPKEITDAVEEYKQEQNQVGQFIEERLDPTGDDKDRLTTSEIYLTYAAWAEVSGYYKLSRQNFTENASKVMNQKSTNIKLENKVVKGWRGYKFR